MNIVRESSREAAEHRRLLLALISLTISLTVTILRQLQQLHCTDSCLTVVTRPAAARLCPRSRWLETGISRWNGVKWSGRSERTTVTGNKSVIGIRFLTSMALKDSRPDGKPQWSTDPHRQAGNKTSACSFNIADRSSNSPFLFINETQILKLDKHCKWSGFLLPPCPQMPTRSDVFSSN